MKIKSVQKFIYFNENLNCCHGRRHDVTCSRRKCSNMTSYDRVNNLCRLTRYQAYRPGVCVFAKYGVTADMPGNVAVATC